MATDSTELTFVRCPSCRSLVPAVSTRCRMCGAGLDAGAGSDDADKEKKSGRVRQRTMSAPDNEVSSALDQVRDEVPPPAPPPAAPPRAAAPPPPPAEPATGDDPLGDYLDEVEETMARKPAAAPPPPAAKPTAVAPPPAAAASMDPLMELLADDGDDSPEAAPEPPKVIVESGRRPFGGSKPGGLSFGRPREEGKPPAAKPAETPPQADNERPEPAAPPREAQPKRPEPRPEPRREEPRREEPRREEPRREERRVEAREEPRREERAAPPPRPAAPQRAVEAPRRVESAAGRLYGWLVSYSDPDGRSIELREGKFFVTGSSLKESDLIIADKSISTPHALVSVGGESGLRLQDLMSDRGVFIRHGESGAYQRRDEPCTVEHGDWVRFGDVEFLVCLIAHVGAR